jgi:hypothetical protein
MVFGTWEKELKYKVCQQYTIPKSTKPPPVKQLHPTLDKENPSVE